MASLGPRMSPSVIATCSAPGWVKISPQKRVFVCFSKRYPQSHHVPDTLLNLGEILFEDGKVDQAAKAYRKITTNYRDTPVYGIALYKLGWCYYNRNEHPQATRDPWEYVERGQVFFTSEPDDPAPAWLPHAMGAVGTRISGMAVDYGHWDATLADCVSLATRNMDSEQAVRAVSTNALDFYGDRLRRRLVAPSDTGRAARPERRAGAPTGAPAW